MDRGTWKATVDGVAKESDMTEQLNHHHHFLGETSAYTEVNQFSLTFNSTLLIVVDAINCTSISLLFSELRTRLHLPDCLAFFVTCD